MASGVAATAAVLVVVLQFLTLAQGQALFGGLCPDKCHCSLDDRGRMEVSCTQGRLLEIPTIRMSPSTEVIRIVPPANQPNHLAIGRFFKQFKKLEELHIVNSNIPNIGEHSFWGVQSLHVLNLTGNNISLIVDSNFKGLINLEVLDLSHNNIDSFVSASFAALVKLKRLNLSWNRATKLVERLFYNLHMLEVLDLSGNWLRELGPDVFRDIWRLKELRCRKCGLKTINPLLYALLPDLKILDLGDNEFKYLNREEFGTLLHLQNLYLDGNQLSAITDDALGSLRLQSLSLASNRIVRIDRSSFVNTSIVDLDLSNNKFDSLDVHVFTNLKTNLTKLNLSRNPRLKMSSLAILISDHPQLKSLSLGENKYEELPLDLFERLRHLEYLNLSANYLTDIYPRQVSSLSSLRVLDLSKNRLKGIDGDVLSYIDGLYHFDDLRLSGNPWACDLCNIPVLLKWIQMHNSFTTACSDPYGPYCLRCSSPPGFADRALISLDESMLEWCKNAEPASILAADPRFGLFLGCGVILLLLIIAAVSIVLHSRWHAAHYYTHEEDRPEIGTPPVPPDYDHLAVNEGFDNLYFTETNGNKTKMIATIEEMTAYDPQATQLQIVHPSYNNSKGKSYNPPQLTSFKQTPSRPTSSSSPILQPQTNFNR